MSDAEDILSRIPGVETRPRRLDRDARRAIVAVLAVTTLAIGMRWWGSPGSPATHDDVAAGPEGAPTGVDALPAALQRLRVPSATGDVDAPAATPAGDAGYEIEDAIGPGRRS